MAELGRWIRRARELAREEARRVVAASRVARQTGALEELTFSGVKAMIRGGGRTNPSTTIRFHAANSPHRPALIDAQSGRSFSYLELDRIIDRVAFALIGLGLSRGDGVLLMLKNVPEFLFLQQGSSRFGGAAVTVSWRSTAHELGFLLENSGAKAIFFDVDCADVVRAGLGSAKHAVADRAFAVGGAVPGFGTLEQLLASAGAAELDDALTEEAALVIYTSGTTGKPKGAVRKFSRDSTLQVMSFLCETPLRVAQRHLTVCPLYHSTAYGFVSLSYALGNTVVMLDFEPTAFLDALERYRIQHTAVVPTLLHRTLELGMDAVRARDTSSLLAIFTGGAPLSPALATRVMDAFGDKLFNFYGATETGFVTLAKPHDLRVAPGTIGRCVGGNSIRILDDEGRPVSSGSVGELYVKSGNLVSGYHANDAATRDSMNDGHFSVGDLARQDDKGYLFLEGRKRDMIISGGVNVYPREVESAIAAHPAVGDVAVVGLPDAEWGERVHAFVEPRAGCQLDEADLLGFCRERLAGPKRPRGFSILPSLPRNPTGKILKRELRALVPTSPEAR
jgi:fatty-acyl-CoA synthase